jgi:hypothetical protein
MKSASQISALIRAKKKKMKEDPDVVDMANKHAMDAQDILDEHEREGAPEDHNEPIESAAEDEADEKRGKRNSEQIDEHEPDADVLKKKARKERIKALLGRVKLPES